MDPSALQRHVWASLSPPSSPSASRGSCALDSAPEVPLCLGLACSCLGFPSWPLRRGATVDLFQLPVPTLRIAGFMCSCFLSLPALFVAGAICSFGCPRRFVCAARFACLPSSGTPSRPLRRLCLLQRTRLPGAPSVLQGLCAMAESVCLPLSVPEPTVFGPHVQERLTGWEGRCSLFTAL